MEIPSPAAASMDEFTGDVVGKVFLASIRFAPMYICVWERPSILFLCQAVTNSGSFSKNQRESRWLYSTKHTNKLFYCEVKFGKSLSLGSITHAIGIKLRNFASPFLFIGRFNWQFIFIHYYRIEDHLKVYSKRSYKLIQDHQGPSAPSSSLLKWPLEQSV